MKHCVILAILLSSSVLFAADKQASCVVDEKSILGRSPSGVPQVSNLGLIEITCRAPGRLCPADAKPGFERFALRLKTVAHQIGDKDVDTVVPSFSNVTGGSGDCGPPEAGFGECNEEQLFWSLNIPIDPTEAITNIASSSTNSLPSGPFRHSNISKSRIAFTIWRHILTSLLKSCSNTGRHFKVECRILDGDRLWAVGQVELEILFKGRAFDAPRGKPQQGR